MKTQKKAVKWDSRFLIFYFTCLAKKKKKAIWAPQKNSFWQKKKGLVQYKNI